MSNSKDKELKGDHVVFSDIQGSFNYLERFLDAIKGMRRDGNICLGDIPHKLLAFSDNRCIDAVKANSDYCVQGNHERNESSESSEKITPENLDYISHLPQSLLLGNVLLFHSSMRENDLRLDDGDKLLAEAEYINERFPGVRFALFGHTHQRGVYSYDGRGIQVEEGDEVQLDLDKLNLINPGAIGVRHGLEKTFARINFETGKANFFTLEGAEEMAYMAGVVNAFDSRWMPVLNRGSTEWFTKYAEVDVPKLKERTGLPSVLAVADNIESFEESKARNKRYLEAFSSKLAESVNGVRARVDSTYFTRDPHTSRAEFLNLDADRLRDSSSR